MYRRRRDDAALCTAEREKHYARVYYERATVRFHNGLCATLKGHFIIIDVFIIYFLIYTLALVYERRVYDTRM